MTNTKKSKSAERIDDEERTRIKRTAIVAMFSDDDLLEQLVLKGGNAMDLVYKVSSRASIDLDFSVAEDLDWDLTKPKVASSLEKAFREAGYGAFDIKMTQKPRSEMPDRLAVFWGGYQVEFKLLRWARFEELSGDLESARREAINLGAGSKFLIDISRHEYTAGKVEDDFEGYMIYVYTPLMIVCEKLRAICQQLPEYGEIIQRNGLGNPRARDFVDIEALVTKCEVDLGSPEAAETLEAMFSVKRVPLKYLAKIHSVRDFHEIDFPGVQASVHAGVQLQPFGYYHSFVVDQCRKLQALWDE